MFFKTSSPACGVGRSGCPMLRWYTCTPRALAAEAKGASFLIGEAGISTARSEILTILRNV